MRSKLINKPVSTPLRAALLAGTTALALVAGSGAARASLLADGITYTLTKTTTSNAFVDNFTLSMSGINSSLDTEKGRTGVKAFAFGPPANYSSASANGFKLESGGLNANGCDGKGNFFCFSNTNPPGTAAGDVLDAGSTLSYNFSITLSSGNFDAYTAPSFKISWLGTKNHYDNVSLPLPISKGNGVGTGVPEPGSLALLGTGLIGLGFAVRRRYRRS